MSRGGWGSKGGGWVGGLALGGQWQSGLMVTSHTLVTGGAALPGGPQPAPPLCRRHGPERDRRPRPIDAAPRQWPRACSRLGSRLGTVLARATPLYRCAPPQVEYAMEAISHAGTAIGILGTDGVVLAAEKKISSKLLEPAKSSEKMYMIAAPPTPTAEAMPSQQKPCRRSSRHPRHARHPHPLFHPPPLPRAPPPPFSHWPPSQPSSPPPQPQPPSASPGT